MSARTPSIFALASIPSVGPSPPTSSICHFLRRQHEVPRVPGPHVETNCVGRGQTSRMAPARIHDQPSVAPPVATGGADLWGAGSGWKLLGGSPADDNESSFCISRNVSQGGSRVAREIVEKGLPAKSHQWAWSGPVPTRCGLAKCVEHRVASGGFLSRGPADRATAIPGRVEVAIASRPWRRDEARPAPGRGKATDPRGSSERMRRSKRHRREISERMSRNGLAHKERTINSGDRTIAAPRRALNAPARRCQRHVGNRARTEVLHVG